MVAISIKFYVELFFVMPIICDKFDDCAIKNEVAKKTPSYCWDKQSSINLFRINKSIDFNILL